MRGPFPTIPIQRVLKGANDVRESELWIEEPADPLDPWGKIHRRVNNDLIKNLARGPIAGDDDLESAMSLARLVRGAYTSFGTDGTANVEPEESRIILRALRMMLERRGLTFDPPWRDYDSFKSHWVSVGASGSGGWQARRDIIGQHFAPIIEALEKAEDDQIRSDLVEPVSPHAHTGWARVDTEIAGLRQRFRTATAMQDYRDCGNRSVAVLEALSATVFDPAKHWAAGEKPPPVDKTDLRIGAYIAERMGGKENEELRGLVKKASAFAHKVKHSPRADRVNAGIAADAVILLANILRRLAE